MKAGSLAAFACAAIAFSGTVCFLHYFEKLYR